jgi:hypothetical protein
MGMMFDAILFHEVVLDVRFFFVKEQTLQFIWAIPVMPF